MNVRRLLGLLAIMLPAALAPCSFAQPALETPSPAVPMQASTEDGARVQPSWIQVEVIVLRQLDTSSAGNERWPDDPQLSYPQPLRFLEDPQATGSNSNPPVIEGTVSGPAPFRLLDANDRLLGDAAARISHSAGYRLLQYLAWRQPAPEGVATHLLVTGGATQAEHHELEGSMTISGSATVQASVRLWLNDFDTTGVADGSGRAGIALPDVPTPPALPAPFAESTDDLLPSPPVEDAPLRVEPVRAARSVPLSATRELEWGKLNYIDHPLFGVLIMMTPFNPEAASEPTDNDVLPQVRPAPEHGSTP